MSLSVLSHGCIFVMSVYLMDHVAIIFNWVRPIVLMLYICADFNSIDHLMSSLIRMTGSILYLNGKASMHWCCVTRAIDSVCESLRLLFQL